MEFTKRISRISESATMAVTAEAGRLKREGVDIVAFGAGEPDFPFQGLQQAGAVIAHLYFGNLLPPDRGPIAARRCL